MNFYRKSPQNINFNKNETESEMENLTHSCRKNTLEYTFRIHILLHIKKYYFMPLRQKCPYLELFWSVFSRIRTEYEEIRSNSPYSVGMRENTDHHNSEYTFHAVYTFLLVFKTVESL